MTFSIEDWALVKPAFSGMVKNETEKVHRVTFTLSKLDMKVFDTFGLETISCEMRNVQFQIRF